MPDGLNTYKSTLTPQEVDEALRNIGNVQKSLEAAEASAEQAKKYADSINPSSFATAKQGELAQSAVQSVNGKTGNKIELSPADIGAATEAQGQLATDAMQAIWVSGSGKVQNKEAQKLDLLQVDLSNQYSDVNAPYFFGSNSPSTDLINTPYSASPFYGYRQVMVSHYGGTKTAHLTTVLIFESYPIVGRIWGNTYDDAGKSWIGWHGTNMT